MKVQARLVRYFLFVSLLCCVIFCVLFGFTILLRGETLTGITSIQYVETSLATSEKFLFQNGKITLFKDGSLKGRAELTKKQKIAFSKIVKLINMDHLSTLAIPSKKFMFDGSAFGQLNLTPHHFSFSSLYCRLKS